MKNVLTIVVLFCSVGAFAQSQFQKETAGSLTYVSGQVMKLADAIPAEKYCQQK